MSPRSSRENCFSKTLNKKIGNKQEAVIEHIMNCTKSISLSRLTKLQNTAILCKKYYVTFSLGKKWNSRRWQ